MTRLEKLEAVAAAADAWERKRNAPQIPMAELSGAANRLEAAVLDLRAFAALNALPAEPQPQGETLALAVWIEPEGGDVYWAVAGSSNDECPEGAFYHRRTVTLPLDRERGE